jgi:hypothetical protein
MNRGMLRAGHDGRSTAEAQARQIEESVSILPRAETCLSLLENFQDLHGGNGPWQCLRVLGRCSRRGVLSGKFTALAVFMMA